MLSDICSVSLIVSSIFDEKVLLHCYGDAVNVSTTRGDRDVTGLFWFD